MSKIKSVRLTTSIVIFSYVLSISLSAEAQRYRNKRGLITSFVIEGIEYSELGDVVQNNSTAQEKMIDKEVTMSLINYLKEYYKLRLLKNVQGLEVIKRMEVNRLKGVKKIKRKQLKGGYDIFFKVKCDIVFYKSFDTEIDEGGFRDMVYLNIGVFTRRGKRIEIIKRKAGNTQFCQGYLLEDTDCYLAMADFRRLWKRLLMTSM